MHTQLMRHNAIGCWRLTADRCFLFLRAEVYTGLLSLTLTSHCAGLQEVTEPLPQLPEIPADTSGAEAGSAPALNPAPDDDAPALSGREGPSLEDPTTTQQQPSEEPPAIGGVQDLEGGQEAAAEAGEATSSAQSDPAQTAPLQQTTAASGAASNLI